MLVQGAYLTADGLVEGWVHWEDDAVRAMGAGAPPTTPDARGFVVPAPLNAHTHLGDAALHGRLDPALGLAALVEPPHGLKHRLLRETTPDVLHAGMVAALRRLRAAGHAGAVDFREGGVPGAEALRAAARETGAAVTILGRAEADRPKETVHDVLAVADGLGIPAVGNLPPGEAARWAETAHAAGKPVAVHASEGVREPLDPVLDLRPHHVVHMTAATPDDLARLADARVPVVVCPRSNATLLGRFPDVVAMREAHALVAIGSDNASLQTPSVFEEMAHLHAHVPDLHPEEVLRMGLLNGWRLHGKGPIDGVEEGAGGPFLVLRGNGTWAATALAPSPDVMTLLGGAPP